MATCINDYGKLTSERMKHKQDISKDVQSLVNIGRFLSDNEAIKGFVAEEIGLQDADDFIRRTTTRKSLDDFDRNATEPERNHVRQVIDAKLNTMAAVSVDAGKLFENQMITDSVYRIFRNLKGKASAAQKLQTLTSHMGGLFSDPSRVLQQHPAARRLKSQYERMANMLKHNAETLIRDGLNKLVKENTVQGLDSRALVKYLPMLDGVDNQNTSKNRMRLRAIREEFRASEYFDRYRDELMRSDPEVTDGMVTDRFTQELLRFRSRWNVLNYGVEDPLMDGYNPRDEKYAKSLVGFIYRAGDMLRDLILDHEKIVGRSGLNSRQKKILDLFDPKNQDNYKGFQVRRNNYVPAKGEIENDIFQKLAFTEDDDADFLPQLPRFLEKRHAAFNETDDFVVLARENVMAFVNRLDLLGQYTMAQGIGDAASRTPEEWFRGNEAVRDTMEWWSKNYVNALKKYQTPKSGMVEVTRNLALGMTSLFGMMLGMPRSAIANYAGGLTGTLSEFGYDFKDMHSAYNRALKGDSLTPEHEAAKMVSDVVEEEFVQGNRMQEFVSHEGVLDSKEKDLFLNASRKARDSAMKMSDVATGRGVLGWLPFTEWITMKGSEERMRRWGGVALYDLVVNEIKAKGIDSETDPKAYRAAIKSAIENNKDDAYFQINAALGDFSPSNRPFWTWAKLKYADNMSDVMLGAAATAWYAFRHVAAHNVNLIARVGVDLVKPKETDFKSFMKHGGGAGGLILMFLFAYDMATRMFKRDVPRAGAVLNANPFQEINTALDGAAVMFAPLLNMSVSEEHADEAMSGLARLAGGVMAGYSLDQAAHKIAEEGGVFGSFDELLGKLGNAARLDKAVLNYVEDGADLVRLYSGEMSADEHYKSRREIHDMIDNPIGLINYTNSFLSFYSRLVPMLARGNTQADDEAIAKRKAYDAKNLLASAFGFSFTVAPEYYNRSKYGATNYWSEYERMESNAREVFRDRMNELEYSPMGRMMSQMRRYGKIYPQSVWGLNID